MKLVIASSLLLFIHSGLACDLTINSTQDIQAGLNAIGVNKTLCLQPGVYKPSATITMQTGQTLRGLASDSQIINQQLVQIKSNADRIIRTADNATVRHLAITRNTPFALPSYGVLAFNDENVTLWTLKITRANIAIGLVEAHGSTLLNNHISLTGDGLSNGANPAIWVHDSDDVQIKYGEVVGRNNPPHGDGEIAAYDSDNLLIDGVHHNYSGTSAIYLVNCDSCTVKNSVISFAQGWGLDVVDGSDNFHALNNTIRYSRLGGSVFYEFDSIGGVWENNNYIYNNQNGGSYCDGINVRNNPANVTLINNTATGLTHCAL